MANGEFGHGKVYRIVRPLGIGTIRPSGGGGDVIFSKQVVKGGDAGFDKLKENDPVRYRKYPEKLGEQDIAEEVIPEYD